MNGLGLCCEQPAFRARNVRCGLYSSAFCNISTKMSKARFSAKRCGTRRRTEGSPFLGLESKHWRDSAAMIRVNLWRQTRQSIYPTRGPLNIVSKAPEWMSSFSRELRPVCCATNPANRQQALAGVLTTARKGVLGLGLPAPAPSSKYLLGDIRIFTICQTE